MSKFYVITESGVSTYNSFNKLTNDIKLEKTDFVKLGNDFVCNMTDMSFDIVKDIKLLETVASKKVFSKDKFDTTNWIQVVLLVFMLLTYLKLGDVLTIIASLGGAVQ